MYIFSIKAMESSKTLAVDKCFTQIELRIGGEV